MDLRLEARAGDAEAQADASGLVHRDAAHPAVARVGRVGPLLEDGQVAAARPELVPADAGGRTGRDAVVYDERLVVTEVAIGEPVHHTVGERVEPLQRPGLRDASASAAGLGVRGHREARGPAERRVRRRRPVDVVLPRGEARGRAERDEIVRRARRREARSIERGREQAAIRGARLEKLLRRGLPREHLRSVERRDARARERAAVREEVHGEVVGIGPDRELRVIGEVHGAVAERVAVVGAGRVTGGRDGDAHEVRRRRHRELADDPAIGDAVVDDCWVAVVVRLAAATEPGPDLVDRHGPVDRRPALVEDREARVDGLDVMIRTDRAICVRRRGVDGERPVRSAEAISDSGK